MLNLERVRALQAVAETGSVASAAKILHVTPSGVSQQLAKLERELGAVLLEPSGRGVRLTAAGELLARRGGELIAQAARVENEVAAMRCEVVGPLRFGAFVAASRAVLPTAVASLLESYPLQVTLAEAETEVTLAALGRRELDIAVVDSWDTMPVQIPPGLECRLIHHDSAGVALPRDHALAQRSPVPLAELAHESWVAWGSGTAFHEWLVRTLRGQGFEPRVDFEVSEMSTHLAFVSAGLAAALVPRLAVTDLPAAAVLLPTEPPLGRDIYAVWRADSMRPAVRAGVAALESAFLRIADNELRTTRAATAAPTLD